MPRSSKRLSDPARPACPATVQRGDRAPGAAVRRGRPGGAAGQRGGHDPAGRREADPAGQQVGALPGPDGGDVPGGAPGKPIRLASKSVRCRGLIEQVLESGGFRGIMAFTLPEALWLAAHGTSQDILVAYPTADRTALARLAGDPVARAAITVMIDCPDHLDMIEKAAAPVPDAGPVIVCIDIDTAYVALGGLIDRKSTR